MFNPFRRRNTEPTPDYPAIIESKDTRYAANLASKEFQVEHLQSEVRRLIAERDEAYALVQSNNAETRRLQELANAHANLAHQHGAGVQADAKIVGQVVAARTSATGMLALCRAVIEGGSSTSAMTAASLLLGYTQTKDAPEDEAGAATK